MSARDVLAAASHDDSANTRTPFPAFLDEVVLYRCSSDFNGFVLETVAGRAIRVDRLDLKLDRSGYGDAAMAIGVSKLFRQPSYSVRALRVMGDQNGLSGVLCGLIDGATSASSLRTLHLCGDFSHASATVPLVCETLRRHGCVEELILASSIPNDKDWIELCDSICAVKSVKSLSIRRRGRAARYDASTAFGTGLRSLLTASGLRKLALEDVDMSSSAQLDDVFAANECLQVLDYTPPESSEASEQACAVLWGVQANKHFKDISLRGLPWETATTGALVCCLTGNDGIQRLTLSGDHISPTANEVSSIIGTNRTHLEVFRFRESGLDDHFFLNLRTSEHLKKLEVYARLPTQGLNKSLKCLKVLSKHLPYLKSLESLLASNLSTGEIEDHVVEAAAAMKQNMTMQRFYIQQRYESERLSDDAVKALGLIKGYTVRNRFHQLVCKGKPADVLRLTPVLLERVNQNPSHTFVGLRKVLDVVPFGSASKKRSLNRSAPSGNE